MIKTKPQSILFVCMGNICRSPTAHGVFRHKVKELGLEHLIAVDSAGTHNYHPGSPPDDRSQEHALKRGYGLADPQAQQHADHPIEWSNSSKIRVVRSFRLTARDALRKDKKYFVNYADK